MSMGKWAGLLGCGAAPTCAEISEKASLPHPSPHRHRAAAFAHVAFLPQPRTNPPPGPSSWYHSSISWSFRPLWILWGPPTLFFGPTHACTSFVHPGISLGEAGLPNPK